MRQKEDLNVSNVCNHPVCLQQTEIPAACLQALRRDSAEAAPAWGLSCIGVQLSQLLQQQARQSMQLFDGDLLKAFLVLEVATRHPLAHGHYHRTGEGVAFSNVHSLAQSTGIPRETVRRKVHELIAAHWLLRLEDGGLVLHDQRLRVYQEQILPAQAQLMLQMADKVRSLQTAMLPADG